MCDDCSNCLGFGEPDMFAHEASMENSKLESMLVTVLLLGGDKLLDNPDPEIMKIAPWTSESIKEWWEQYKKDFKQYNLKKA